MEVHAKLDRGALEVILCGDKRLAALVPTLDNDELDTPALLARAEAVVVLVDLVPPDNLAVRHDL